MRPMKTIAAAIAAFLLLAPPALAQIQGTTGIQRGSAGALSSLTINTNAILTGPAAATFQMGAADAAAPVAQTLGVQSVVAGTSNTAGVTTTIRDSAGTGTGVGGNIIFQYAPHGSSGTAQNAFATALTINGDTGSVLGITGTASNPTFASSADPTTGMYFNADSTIRWSQAGTQRLQLGGTGFSGVNSNGWALLHAPASATAPTLVPNQSSATTGWGAQAAGNMSAIVGGTEVARFVTGGMQLPGALIASGTAPVGSGTCTRGTQTGGLTAGSIVLTCTAQTLILTFTTTAPTGWMCEAIDQTTVADTMKQTSNTTTSCTLTGTTAASDVVIYQARAY